MIYCPPRKPTQSAASDSNDNVAPTVDISWNYKDVFDRVGPKGQVNNYAEGVYKTGGGCK